VRTGHIYALAEPDTGEVRYVGKTLNGVERRVRGHVKSAHDGGRLYVHNWLRKLDVPPQFIIIEALPEDELAEAEKYWIKFMRLTGARLTNLSYGGEGGSLAEEVRARIGEANRGRSNPKASARLTGRKHSPERRAKLREAMQNISPEKRAAINAKISEANRDPSPETRARISESARGRKKQSPESIAKNAEARRGQKRSPETRARMSAAAFRRWERKRCESTSTEIELEK
jgi:hypothetical protein